MNREHKLYAWAIIFFLLASCFVLSGSYVIVAILGTIGVVAALTGFRVEARNGQR